MKTPLVKLYQPLLHEPLVHFVVLAALLFAASAFWPGDGREEIVVDRGTAEFLIQQESDLLLRSLTPEEEAQVIAEFVEEEILFREAKKRGFDSSSRIRSMMVQNMRFLSEGDVDQPTEEDLRAFFEQERERFETPPTITFDQVFFSDPEAVPADTLDRLRSGADSAKLGDSNRNVPSRITDLDQRRMVEAMGPDVARQLLAIEDDEWYGPMESRLGAHFLRIADRQPSRLPDFEGARRWIEAVWMQARQREILDRELSGMRPNYRVMIEPRDGAVGG